MIDIGNYDDVQPMKAGGRPGAGVYACKIEKVVNFPEKQYVRLYLDICAGEYKDHGKELEETYGDDWGYITCFLSYKPKARGFLRDKLDVIAISSKKNPRDIWLNFSSSEGMNLAGLYVGIVVGEREYQKNDGTIGVTLALPDLFINASEAKNNPEKYADKIPALKKLVTKQVNEQPAPPLPDYAPEEIPF